MTDDKTHTFDWQKEGEGTFLKWMMLTVFDTRDQPLFDELSEKTDHFQAVELGVTINGIPVDAKNFMERVEEQMDWAVGREAEKKVKAIEGLPELYKILGDLERGFKAKVTEACAKAGVKFDEEPWGL